MLFLYESAWALTLRADSGPVVIVPPRSEHRTPSLIVLIAYSSHVVIIIYLLTLLSPRYRRGREDPKHVSHEKYSFLFSSNSLQSCDSGTFSRRGSQLCLRLT